MDATLTTGTVNLDHQLVAAAPLGMDRPWWEKLSDIMLIEPPIIGAPAPVVGVPLPVDPFQHLWDAGARTPERAEWTFRTTGYTYTWEELAQRGWISQDGSGWGITSAGMDAVSRKQGVNPTFEVDYLQDVIKPSLEKGTAAIAGGFDDIWNSLESKLLLALLILLAALWLTRR